MKKLDRFVLSSFIGPFAAILLVVVFVLILQFLWLYIDELVGKGLGVKVILEFMLWGACTTLPIALPLATLLSSMMVVGNLGENNELIALKAAGVSVSRVMAPVMVAAVFISIGTYFVINELVPVAYNQIFTLRDDIKKTKNEIKIPDGVFYDGVEGYVLRVDNTAPDGMMNGVMLYDHHGKGNTRLTIADSAEIRMSKDKSYLTIKMYNGTNYQETNEKDGRKETLQLQKIYENLRIDRQILCDQDMTTLQGNLFKTFAGFGLPRYAGFRIPARTVRIRSLLLCSFRKLFCHAALLPDPGQRSFPAP